MPSLCQGDHETFRWLGWGIFHKFSKKFHTPPLRNVSLSPWQRNNETFRWLGWGIFIYYQKFAYPPLRNVSWSRWQRDHETFRWVGWSIFDKFSKKFCIPPSKKCFVVSLTTKLSLSSRDKIGKYANAGTTLKNLDKKKLDKTNLDEKNLNEINRMK